MFVRIKKLFRLLLLCTAGFCVTFITGCSTAMVKARPELLNSQVVSWDAAQLHQADWGQMRTYFRGQTPGTKDVLTAVAVVEPGKAVHRAHRHAEEEYLVVVIGSGTWFLADKQFSAQRGDILYVEPWVYHGLTNTGDEQLIFVVVRYSPKGLKPPPRPDNRKDEL